MPQSKKDLRTQQKKKDAEMGIDRTWRMAGLCTAPPFFWRRPKSPESGGLLGTHVTKRNI